VLNVAVGEKKIEIAMDKKSESAFFPVTNNRTPEDMSSTR
jgi:hypothetical protein